MSPLQYQKQLRLHAARERMLIDGLDAASAAFEVGYESATQIQSRIWPLLWPTTYAGYSDPSLARPSVLRVGQ
jgi:methylphosphotriester-DNA--protein-cysteine methyltransferase